MSDQTEQLPEKPADGDGIKVTFEPQGNGVTAATISDVVRRCTLIFYVSTRDVRQHPELVHEFLNHRLAQTLNRKSFSVGCFHNGKPSKGSGSGSMPERHAPLSPPTRDPARDPVVRNLVDSLFDPPSPQEPLIAWRSEATPQG